MSVINVYEQYFGAEGSFNGVKRNGALVMLISDSEAGNVRYEVAVSFFPHKDESDFAVSYDAYFSKEIFASKGRRSKKREKVFLETFRDEIDSLSEENGAKVLWDRPLRDARFG